MKYILIILSIQYFLYVKSDLLNLEISLGGGDEEEQQETPADNEVFIIEDDANYKPGKGFILKHVLKTRKYYPSKLNNIYFLFTSPKNLRNGRTSHVEKKI